MVPITSLDELREALDGLTAMGFVSADGPLERRGATVDHALYPPSEAPPAPLAAAAPGSAAKSAAAPAAVAGVAADELAALRESNETLRSNLSDLTDRVARLSESLDDLRRDLGVS